MCKLNKDMLQLYIDGQMSPLEILLLEEHLRECPSCRKELNSLKILDWDLRKTIERIEVPSELSRIRLLTLNQHLEESSQTEKAAFGLKNVYELQYNTWKNSLSFIQFLPGNKLVGNSGKKLLQGKLKPSFLSKIIGF